MKHRDAPVDTKAIRHVALMTVEGENDDISGLGQTKAAHTICPNIPDAKRLHYMQPDVGHYGVFNGSRFRREIAPRIVEFTRLHAKGVASEKPAATPRRNAKGGRKAG
jgi:poly(3-hydroxybutyrate) depolymerase